MRTWLIILLLTFPAWAQPDPARALRELQTYIRIPSVNPPADSRPTAAFLRALLEKEGVKVETYASAPDKDTIVARLPGRIPGEDLVLLHHMDVVPADASRWPVDPFAAEVKDGFLYGRGAVDMKCIGIMQLLSFLALKDQPLERGLVLMATPDEESGGEAGAVWMLKHHPMGARYILDEGGFATPDLLADRLTFAISVAEKKIIWLKLKAVGTAGHGSQPTLDNPNDRLMRTLQRLQALAGEGDSPLVEELRQRVGPLKDNKFTRAIQRDTMSVTSLRSGVGEPPKVNVIPSLAEATVDFRLLPSTDANAFLVKIKAALEPGVTLEVLNFGEHAPVSPTQTPLFEALEKTIRGQYPDAVVTPYLVPFGTDSNTFREAGACCYGFNPIILNAELVATMHSDAERIPVAALAPGLQLYYDCVRNYCVRGASPGQPGRL